MSDRSRHGLSGPLFLRNDLPMRQSLVIDIDGAFVGAALRLEHAWRFVATDTRVDALHFSQWPTLEDLRRRVHLQYRAAGPMASPTSGSAAAPVHA